MAKGKPRRGVCFLYWLYTEGMEDLTTEGYVGITNNPEKRLKEHVRNSLKGGYKINPEFKAVLASGQINIKILASGDRDYISDLEYQLRPRYKIGWNLQVGGKNEKLLRFGEGLSKRDGYKTYCALSYRTNGNFIDDWKGEDGLKNFLNWFDDYPKEPGKLFWVVDKNSEVGPENLKYCDRSDGLELSGNKLYSKKLNRSNTVDRWGKELNIAPNQISSRLRNGWSVDEALSLVDKDPYKLLKEEDLDNFNKQMAVYWLENSLKTPNQIREDVSLTTDLKTALKHFKLPKWKFEKVDVPCPISCWVLRMKRNPRITDFEVAMEIYNMWEHDGYAINRIAKETGYSYQVIKTFVEGLEDAEWFG